MLHDHVSVNRLCPLRDGLLLCCLILVAENLYDLGSLDAETSEVAGIQNVRLVMKEISEMCML